MPHATAGFDERVVDRSRGFSHWEARKFYLPSTRPAECRWFEAQG